MDVRAVLVAVDHATGRAGAVIDAEGDVWLMDDLEHGCGIRLDDYLPVCLGVDGDRTVLGGRLPRGCVAVEAITDCGDRVPCHVGDAAWVVVLDQPASGWVSPVLRRDRAGAPVAPPLPADWTREPVTDSREPCPACDAVAWDVVTPSDRSRGWRGGGEPSPVVVCRVCGHEEAMGAIRRFPASEGEDPEAVHVRMRESEETQKLSHRMLLSAVTFPIYAVEGLPGRIGGSGSSGDDVTSVTVAHPRQPGAPGSGADVTTAREDHHESNEASLARAALAGWLYDGLAAWTGGSDAAFALRLAASERARRRAAARAQVAVCQIAVDGAPHRFTCISSGPCWAAVARSDSVIITVTAAGIEPGAIRLRALSDPAETLI